MLHLASVVTRQAMEILRNMPKQTEGTYILSSREGRMPIKGVAKLFRTTLSSQKRAPPGHYEDLLTDVAQLSSPDTESESDITLTRQVSERYCACARRAVD